MKTLAIFDLDGTLLSTMEGLAFSVNYAREQQGLKPQPTPQIQSYIGNGAVKLIQRSLKADNIEDEEKTKQMLKDFNDHYNEHCIERTTPYNGIQETIKELNKQGILTACISNKNDYPSKKLCGHFFQKDLMYVAGSKPDVPRKPDPTAVNECLKTLNKQPNDAVYIGDSEVDIRTAQNSNMPCISVSWGFKTKDFLRENGATTIVDTMEELKTAIKSIG